MEIKHFPIPDSLIPIIERYTELERSIGESSLVDIHPDVVREYVKLVAQFFSEYFTRGFKSSALNYSQLVEATRIIGMHEYIFDLTRFKEQDGDELVITPEVSVNLTRRLVLINKDADVFTGANIKRYPDIKKHNPAGNPLTTLAGFLTAAYKTLLPK